MNKDNMIRLQTYANSLKDKLSARTLPPKQVNRPEAYKAFLTHELNIVNGKLEAMRLGSIPEVKNK